METVFINGRFYEQPVSGVQRYGREIVRALDRLASTAAPTPIGWTLLVPNGVSLPSLDAISVRRIGGFGGHAWEQTVLPASSAGAPLLNLGMSAPLGKRRQLVTLHDAAVFRHPEHFGQRYGLLHRNLELFLGRHNNLSTVSEFSRRELSDVLSVPEDRIVVAPNGADHAHAPPSYDSYDRLGLKGSKYFVTVGNLTDNKNMKLVAAAAELLDAPNFKVVVVGSANPKLFASALSGDVAQLTSDHIVFAGRLPDDELFGLMRRAVALIFPSKYEGFGIPPLEAMVNCCPVLGSDIPAVHEVCGRAARYFDPYSAEELASCMLSALRWSDEERAEIVRLGLSRGAGYTWQRAARILWGRCSKL